MCETLVSISPSQGADNNNCYHFSSVYYVPGTILSGLNSSTLTITQWDRFYYYPHLQCDLGCEIFHCKVKQSGQGHTVSKWPNQDSNSDKCSPRNFAFALCPTLPQILMLGISTSSFSTHSIPPIPSCHFAGASCKTVEISWVNRDNSQLKWTLRITHKIKVPPYQVCAYLTKSRFSGEEQEGQKGILHFLLSYSLIPGILVNLSPEEIFNWGLQCHHHCCHYWAHAFHNFSSF